MKPPAALIFFFLVTAFTLSGCNREKIEELTRLNQAHQSQITSLKGENSQLTEKVSSLEAKIQEYSKTPKWVWENEVVSQASDCSRLITTLENFETRFPSQSGQYAGRITEFRANCEKESQINAMLERRDFAGARKIASTDAHRSLVESEEQSYQAEMEAIRGVDIRYREYMVESESYGDKIINVECKLKKFEPSNYPTWASGGVQLDCDNESLYAFYCSDRNINEPDAKPEVCVAVPSSKQSMKDYLVKQLNSSSEYTVKIKARVKSKNLWEVLQIGFCNAYSWNCSNFAKVLE